MTSAMLPSIPGDDIIRSAGPNKDALWQQGPPIIWRRVQRIIM
jgi:hypothetical protein